MESISQGQWLEFWRLRKMMLDYLPRLREGLDAGVRQLERAERSAPPDRTAAARSDLRTTQAALSTITSAIHLLRYWEQLAAIPGARTADAQTEIIKSVNDIVGAERENTRRMLDLVKQDRRLFYCACTKYAHPAYVSGGFIASGLLSESMTVVEMLQTKLDTMQAEDYTGQLKRAFSGCCADLINWGVRPEKQ